ncbi:uncharacterized protein LOC131666944 [Phymastichus coffea]|uniref:uncharacterized protein LOC131666944 n=1 Tax=Phymastichus coffea TaxID=108790 RepID=UPI00273CCB15|nr:uncharacterized protein LOC131666944 [Phymastichus coffea]
MTEIRQGAKSPELLRDELAIVLGKVGDLKLASRAAKLSCLYLKLKRSPLAVRLKRKASLGLAVLALACALRWARTYYENVRFDRCLLDVPSFARQVFRPAEDCSICQDVQQVEKIARIDAELFEERYAYSGRPVVITDAAADWTAMEQFSFAFLKQLYEGREADCQFFPYETEFRSLRDVFNMSAGRALLRAGTRPWYVGWSNCDETIGAILRQHYRRPYFLPDTAESEKTDWLFMGSPGYGAPMHVDDVEYPSWQAQIRGRKRWILEPPRECHYVCRRLEVTVDPGEILVLDTNKWYHQTTIVSEDISITIGAEYD